MKETEVRGILKGIATPVICAAATLLIMIYAPDISQGEMQVVPGIFLFVAGLVFVWVLAESILKSW